MQDRKALILNIIIQEHIKTGVPVGSGVIVEKYKLGVSSATVRNQMAELENEGLIIQPHTSAGRIPTEKAYQEYLNNINGAKLKKEIKKELDMALNKRDEMHFKHTAKIIAKFSGNAVFWAFERNNLFYTGISNLFTQPEFASHDLIYSISGIIDRLDEIINEIYSDIKYKPIVMIGTKNPFSRFCSSVVTKYIHNNNSGLMGIIGPIRMDYKNNLALVSYVREKISDK